MLVDWDIFAEAEPALEALISSSSSSSSSNYDRAEPALEWCRRHAARLKKLRSPLPFRLHISVLGGASDAAKGVLSEALPPLHVAVSLDACPGGAA